MAVQMFDKIDWNKFGVLVENVDQNIDPKIISNLEDFNKMNDQWYVGHLIEKGREFFIETDVDTLYGSVSYYVIYIDELKIQSI